MKFTTPFTPVTQRCPLCKRVYVEWVLSSELVKKKTGRVNKQKCDVCYGDHIPAKDRIEICRLMIRRRKACHKKYWSECNRDYLDIVHREMMVTGREVYVSHIPLDKSPHSSQLVDRTDGSSL